MSFVSWRPADSDHLFSLQGGDKQMSKDNANGKLMEAKQHH